jgi:hypothetical protein
LLKAIDHLVLRNYKNEEHRRDDNSTYGTTTTRGDSRNITVDFPSQCFEHDNERVDANLLAAPRRKNFLLKRNAGMDRQVEKTVFKSR